MRQSLQIFLVSDLAFHNPRDAPASDFPELAVVWHGKVQQLMYDDIVTGLVLGGISHQLRSFNMSKSWTGFWDMSINAAFLNISDYP